MNQETLALPTNLEERRTLLEAELQKVAYALIARDLVPCIKELFTKANVPPIERLSWEFYPESDDEGGTKMYITSLCAYDKEEKAVHIDDYSFQKEFYGNDGTTYTSYVGDELIDILYDFRSDLEEYEIDELQLS